LENSHSQDSTQLTNLLQFWNRYLIDNAQIIQTKRQELVDYFNGYANLGEDAFQIEYQKSELSETLFQSVLSQELKYHRTLIGPQIDEFVVSKKEVKAWKKLSSFGSRSEQRMGVLWLKLIQLKYLQTCLNQKPILLLDDVFSEFDEANSEKIFNLCAKYQVFITTTNLKFLDKIRNLGELIEIN
jgi:DNA replication and repair protein RecF